MGILGNLGLRGGSAELVEELLGSRADLNFQNDIYRDLSLLGRLFVLAKSFQHRFGRATAMSALSYHTNGCTPLIAALQTAQYEGAAALIAAGARLDLTNEQPRPDGCRLC